MTQTPSVTASITATLTRTPSHTPQEVAPTIVTVDPFFTTPAATWTPRDTDTPTPTVLFTPPGLTIEAPPAVTLGPSDIAPESPLPTLTPGSGDSSAPEATSTPTLTPPPRVPPVTPPPTLSVALIQVLLPPPEAVGGLPFQVDPGALSAASQFAESPSDYQPFRVPNPARPGEAIVTDEFGVMYWEVNGQRRGMPAPFTSFGPGSLENSDKLVTAASWSPDGSKIAFVVDNPQRGDANDGVWWWDTGTGEAYQVMHNCRRNVRNCPDFVNAEGDPYVNPPVGEPEDFNTGWYAVSVSWSPDGTRLLARLRIREDERLAFIVLPLAADGEFKKLRRDVCKYEFSDWASNSRAVIVGGRDATGQQVLGVVEVPENVPLDGAVACGDIRPLDTTGANTVRVTPAVSVSGTLPSGVVEGSEFEAGQELVVASPNSEGLNLRTEPNADVPNVIRYLLNGEFVRVLAGPFDQGALRWWRVRTAQGEEGWIVSAIGGTQVLQIAP
ncbi:MAG: SH3 domain-containing protein [Chloroflexi bacterium]|nr:SH3 domain-containing protein [Chloroflexota bacterium]